MKAFSWTEAPHGAIVADGKRLEAAAYGPPPAEAPTLVLLHEGLGCVALWRDFPEKLALETGFGVFVYSRAGYGHSDPVDLPRPLDYMTREARTSLPVVLGAIGLRKGVLVGHSDGASISIIYGGDRTDERVRGLALMAPHVFAEPPGLASIHEAKRAYDAGELKARLARYHAHVDCAFRGWNDAWLGPNFETWNIESFVDHWRAPALLIQGADDQYGTLKQTRAIEKRSPAPVETLILDNCHHSPQFERPKATLDAIAAFCKKVLGTGR
ncbi:MAG: alpha/beta fold hydrolase [Hyphomicrobiales bacterium]|nr:alpha/beta fold hydrolase [Hyphomicrobiales bacterium]MBV8439254.1 alpha/beta fold hydrolase [Hyphomicrobiales bacterium]